VIDLGAKQDCVCKKFNSIPSECVNEYTFRDSGKQVQLKPNSSERTTLIAIDNCLITSQKRRKCDCIFIYEKSNKKIYSFLTELKGKNHIRSSFEQLQITKGYEEYQQIITHCKIPKSQQKFVIVSDIQLNKVELTKLENEFKIRVGSILHSDPQTPIPDLKSKI